MWKLMCPTTYDRYLTANEFISFLQCLSAEDNVTIKEIGRSVRNLKIVALYIGKVDSKKPIVVCEAGAHAQEWLASAACLFVITELLGTKRFQELLDRIDFVMIPLLNPDGYHYSKLVDRGWRKNRNDTVVDHCIGVDLNRNFSYKWGSGAVGVNPCEQYYRGECPFSEPETRALRDFLLPFGDRIKIYLSIHCPLQTIQFPWGYGIKPAPDYDDLERLAKEVKSHIQKYYHTEYDVGQQCLLSKKVPGCSIDWAKHDAKIKYCYTIDLPGPQWSYEAPPEAIVRYGKELLAMVLTFCTAIKLQK